jgi:hypothetical protein
MRPKHLFLAAVALAVTAPPASAQDYTLSLTGPPGATTGQTVQLNASGTNSTSGFLQRYLNVYAIPTSVLASCPATYQGAIQVKENSTGAGSETVANHVPETADAAGSWSAPIVWTPSVPGRFNLCAYTHEGAGTDATATHAMTISAPGGGGANGVAKPANVKRPKVVRRGRKLTCSRGRWSNGPTSFSYRWVVNGRRRKGASRTLAVTRKLRRRSVRCAVTARSAGGSTTVLSRPLRVR